MLSAEYQQQQDCWYRLWKNSVLFWFRFFLNLCYAILCSVLAFLLSFSDVVNSDFFFTVTHAQLLICFEFGFVVWFFLLLLVVIFRDFCLFVCLRNYFLQKLYYVSLLSSFPQPSFSWFAGSVFSLLFTSFSDFLDIEKGFVRNIHKSKEGKY